MTTQINVHIYTLKFTRDGLDTKEPIELTVGEHNQIELVRPTRLMPSAAGMGGFEVDSCFPMPGALSVFLGLALGDALVDLFDAIFRRAEEPTTRIFQIYGHADPSGDDGNNKTLSEKRAEAIRAILVRDIDAFVALGEAEGWGLREQQVMLRVLQCDPGPIDGLAEELTQAAVEDFQSDYTAGVFHRHTDLQPRNPGLAVDGDLGPQTFKALLEALVLVCSPGIPPEQIHPTHPAVGCAAFNRISDASPAMNRRVTLAVHDALPPHHDTAPCVEGNHSACPFDDRDLSGCLWYREHVQDPLETEFQHQHYDLRWLPLKNGGILLSALTTLQEEDEVVFRVFRAGELVGPEDIHHGNLAEPISEAMRGLVRCGVAQVVWMPEVEEGGFDPLNSDDWYDPVDFETAVSDPLGVWKRGPRLRPPVFEIRGGGATALSKPPGQEPHRIRVEDEQGAAIDTGRPAVGTDVYGRMVHVPLEAGRSTVGRAVRGTLAPVIAFDVPGTRSINEEGEQE